MKSTTVMPQCRTTILFTSIILYPDTILAAYLVRILPSSHLTPQLRGYRSGIIGGFVIDRFFNSSSHACLLLHAHNLPVLGEAELNHHDAQLATQPP